jgi:hypothetical protein
VKVIEGEEEVKPPGPDHVKEAPALKEDAVKVASELIQGVASSKAIVGAAGAPGFTMLNGPKVEEQELPSVTLRK